MIEMQYKARQTSSRVDALPFSLFTDPDRPHRTYPCLSSRIKAATSRHLAPTVSSIFEDLRAEGNEEDSHIAAMLEGLVLVYDAVESQSHFLSAEQVAQLREGMEACLQHYRWLHVAAYDAAPRRYMWNEVPKHHDCQHLAQQAELQNPRWSWCYPDEDFMGYLKTITESCLAGTKCHRVVSKVLAKWSFGVMLRMSRARREDQVE